MTSEITLVKADDYVGLFIDGVLYSWDDYYNFDFEYGFTIALEHPNAKLTIKHVDLDWLFDECGGDIPNNLSDVKFY